MKKNKQFKQSLIASAMGIAIFGLSACGGDSGGGDKGDNNIQLSGAVVDDFVAYARVYVDVDNNGEFNPAYEPYAYTDAEGYFSKSKKGINYCDLSPKDFNYRYCFEADQAVKQGGIVRVQNGVDLLTTQVYEVSMSLLMNGTTDGLTLTPLTSGDEAINNDNLIQAAVNRLNLTAQQIADVQSQYADYLKGYLNPSQNAPFTKQATKASLFGFNLNTYNPLEFDKGDVGEEDRGFKLAIQLHKIAEAIAKEILPLNTPDGLKELERKDLMPTIYFALIYELITNNANNNAKDLFASKAVVDDVFDTAKKLLSEIFGNQYSFGDATGNIPSLTALLNCVLSSNGDAIIDIGHGNDVAYGGELCASIRDYTDKDSQLAKLFSAELATDVITEITPNDNFLHALNQAKKVSQKALPGQPKYDANGNDFTTASEKIRGGGLAVAKTLDFNTDVFADNYLDFSTNSNKILADFKPDGTVDICQSTNNTSVDTLISGTWAQDQTKEHIIYVNYLNLPIVLKNLDVNQSTCTDDFGTGVPGTCLTYEYPDINNNGERKTLLKTSAGEIGGGGSDDIAKPRSQFSCNNPQNNQQ